ncbi:hypothetical protein LOTGIDRAFT_175917 [Lottia gigantea]|uniref:Reverse transcriptase zinc-binding domain-containing protein n=1 Tax=Lottia gigantea TaxID=225164 RepID=V3ZUN4_LOTGI|nr:hypothetical protein LOTGIDRAFT_175917 [Lottia gigantea]ESO88072.1 hypothetical protein LOTGIDRAFT_175917 [Lottia gigantea]
MEIQEENPMIFVYLLNQNKFLDRERLSFLSYNFMKLFDTLIKLENDYKNFILILGGDLNNVLDVELERKGGNYKEKLKENFESQIIWNNINIKIGGSPIFDKTIFEEGYIHVKDILLKSTTECGNLTLLGIKLIKKLSKESPTHTLKTITIPEQISRNLYMLYKHKLDAIKPKYIYDIQIKKYYSKPKGIQVWEKYLDNELLEEDIKSIFKEIQDVCCNIKSRNFKYKFLNRIIFTNDKLCKIGKESLTLCDLCGSCIESLEHLFISCSESQKVWDILSSDKNCIKLTTSLKVFGL